MPLSTFIHPKKTLAGTMTSFLLLPFTFSFYVMRKAFDLIYFLAKTIIWVITSPFVWVFSFFIKPKAAPFSAHPRSPDDRLDDFNLTQLGVAENSEDAPMKHLGNGVTPLSLAEPPAKQKKPLSTSTDVNHGGTKKEPGNNSLTLPRSTTAHTPLDLGLLNVTLKARADKRNANNIPLLFFIYKLFRLLPSVGCKKLPHNAVSVTQDGVSITQKTHCISVGTATTVLTFTEQIDSKNSRKVIRQQFTPADVQNSNDKSLCNVLTIFSTVLPFFLFTDQLQYKALTAKKSNGDMFFNDPNEPSKLQSSIDYFSQILGDLTGAFVRYHIGFFEKPAKSSKKNQRNKTGLTDLKQHLQAVEQIIQQVPTQVKAALENYQLFFNALNASTDSKRQDKLPFTGFLFNALAGTPKDWSKDIKTLSNQQNPTNNASPISKEDYESFLESVYAYRSNHSSKFSQEPLSYFFTTLSKASNNSAVTNPITSSEEVKDPKAPEIPPILTTWEKEIASKLSKPLDPIAESENESPLSSPPRIGNGDSSDEHSVRSEGTAATNNTEDTAFSGSLFGLGL